MDERKKPRRYLRHSDAEDPDRYVAIGTTEDEVVIFDRQVDSAWVKSTFAIELEAME